MENEIKDILVKLLEGQTRLESEVKKNSIQLEKIQTNINTLAEVQQSFSEQLGRSKDKEGKSLSERLEVIELAVTSTSKSLTVLDGKLDDLQFDVNNLSIKTTKTDNKVILFEKQLKEDNRKRG